MSNQIDIIIGGNISRMRTMAGFTQKSFGEACNPSITSQQVSKYELGDNSASGVRLCDFAAVLKCRVADLFKGLEGDGAALERGTRADYELMSDYQVLPEHMQVSVRGLIHSMAKEMQQ